MGQPVNARPLFQTLTTTENVVVTVPMKNGPAATTCRPFICGLAEDFCWRATDDATPNLVLPTYTSGLTDADGTHVHPPLHGDGCGPLSNYFLKFYKDHCKAWKALKQPIHLLAL